ncbi:pseudouridine synthase [Coprinopsis marcescibilis]|uniref:Pseudouridine synthase n=1 Tax=Coprinopsis marcescibilis TaxID=230819 RepID=A0A5C3L9E3_COPMA|nr:pseudouridine synthase [Coprinopsis marcescibilis]
MSSIILREREQGGDDEQRYAKRQKTEYTSPLVDDAQNDATTTAIQDEGHVLPASHALLGIPLPVKTAAGALNFLETDVGISEYIGRGEAKVEGIIKQRFTDFLVFEVDQDGNTIHLKTLEKPKGPKQEPQEPKEVPKPTSEPPEASKDAAPDSTATGSNEKPKEPPAVVELWPQTFDETLERFLSKEKRDQLKAIFLEGPEAPLISDSGWGGRVAAKVATDGQTPEPTPEALPEAFSSSGRGGRGSRGGRGGRGGLGGRQPTREDNRKVVSDPIDSKDVRTAFHKTVRELFKGKLDTETDTNAPTDDGQRIVIKWGRGGRSQGRGGLQGSDSGGQRARGTYPPYIQFMLQKTNRDTQDALGHLSRMLHVNVKDLAVAGTKDKRGVTVQRVSLKRNNKTVEDVWRLGNGINGSRTAQTALSQRGERGIRIADLVYRKSGLELGMLKGNAFIITLRNVKVESMEILDETLTTVKNKGFINYYGMQRFGTASVPTHSIGLALLKSDWNKAVSLILQKRHGEHPDVAAARDAWLIERDADKALQLLPRRVVAERCILESFKKMKGDTRNAMGALSTIPKNLRLMYIHAYQSYVWNAVVSERIRTFGTDKPVVGDLVLEKDAVEDNKMDVDGEEKGHEKDEEEEEESGYGRRRNRKPYVAPRIRTLTEEDLDKYTIFDVVMPLPGTDVAYPGGTLGERYREFLRMDGLDPDNFVRKQREYTLNGSYRAILHLPREMSWSVLRYTNPDVPLAQADEDQLLGFDPPAVVPDGKFTALQIRLTLGTAAYATMALREVTKMDTSSHIQTGLTQVAEDQKFKSTEADVLANAEGEAEAEVALEADGDIVLQELL